MYKDSGFDQTAYVKASKNNGTNKWWGLKLTICMIYDFFYFTLGRVLFAIPFAGEPLGMSFYYAMFGKQGLFYGLETNQS